MNSWNYCVSRDFRNEQGEYTCPEALVKITGQVETQDLYSHCTALVFAPEDRRITPVALFNKLPLQTIDHVHGFWYLLLTTTHLAQDIKQLVPISIAHSIVQHLGSELA